MLIQNQLDNDAIMEYEEDEESDPRDAALLDDSSPVEEKSMDGGSSSSMLATPSHRIRAESSNSHRGKLFQ